MNNDRHPALLALDAVKAQSELAGKGIEATGTLLAIVQSQGQRINDLEARLRRLERRRWWKVATP